MAGKIHRLRDAPARERVSSIAASAQHFGRLLPGDAGPGGLRAA
ncbi:hypothetical protein [Microbacterium sp. ProA8]